MSSVCQPNTITITTITLLIAIMVKQNNIVEHDHATGLSHTQPETQLLVLSLLYSHHTHVSKHKLTELKGSSFSTQCFPVSLLPLVSMCLSPLRVSLPEAAQQQPFVPEDQSANSSHLHWLILWSRWSCSPSHLHQHKLMNKKTDPLGCLYHLKPGFERTCIVSISKRMKNRFFLLQINECHTFGSSLYDL